ncbi:PilW family protein [Marinagarivorans algicola]|uniref:PilW family protein n=1 Tax=Marinagarivorans algicola TaxID=1513270 RepID=UPI0006B99D9C|nr:PilW family protein [Marinagarivorans algicola]
MIKQYTKNSGFTLIELMISMLITSIVLSAVFNLFINNSLSYNLQQSIASIQEEGRYASQSLSQSFMLAGYSETNLAQPAIRIRGADGANLISVKRKEANAAGQKGGGEQYTINGKGKMNNFDQVVLLLTDGENCAGNDIWPAPSGSSHWKYIYVNDKFQLICADSAGNNEQITSRVEAFQIQYGIDTNASGEVGFHQPNTYVSLPDHTQRIVAIRFAILLKSNSSTRTPQEFPKNYRMSVLDRNFKNGTGYNKIDFNDGHLRRLFFSSVKLRNGDLNSF